MTVSRIVSPNRLRGSGAHIEDTTFDVTTLPAENLRHPNLYKVARSAAGAGQHVTIDFGSAMSFQAVAILAHTIVMDWKIRLAGHTSNNWDTPASGWLNLRPMYNSDKIIGFFSELQTYRYVRLEIGCEYQFDIGGLVVGPYWQPPYPGYTELTPISQPTRDGRLNVMTLRFGFEKLSQADRAELLEIFERHRQVNRESPYQWGSEPALWILDTTNQIAADGLQKFSLYGVWVGELSTPIDDYSLVDRVSFAIEECK